MLQRLAEVWYRPGHPLGLVLAPLGWIYAASATVRRRLYESRMLASQSVGVPVVVVGNLTVGGTGKTPLVLWLARLLAEHGWHPGIATRGYGALGPGDIVRVLPVDDPGRVGDEPLLLAQRGGVPVIAAPDRVRAASRLVSECGCDVIVCDDGLQHLRLQRDIEILVVDGERRFGNGRCLPAGPLREPASRAEQVDLVIVNGAAAGPDEMAMQLHAGDAVALGDDGQLRSLDSFADGEVHAVAGIGNPSRFFDTLAAHRIAARPHAFPDHHRFVADDLDFGDDLPVLMTEKDAVKCRAFARPGVWFVPVTAVLPGHLGQWILERLVELRNGPKAA